MSQNPDRNPHHNERDTNEGTERNNPDGSLRCPIFVQDTDELIDEDGTTYYCWVDDEAWADEQRARQNAVLSSPFASLTTATAKPSKNTPVVDNTSAAIPSATTTTNIPSVPSAATEIFSDTPITKKNVPSEAAMDSKPAYSSSSRGGENDSVSLSPMGLYFGNYQDTVEDENEGDNEEEDDSGEHNDDRDDDYDDEYDDDNIEDRIENNTEDENEKDSGDEVDVYSEPEDNEGNLNTDTVEAAPSNPLNNTIIICYYRWKFSIQLGEKAPVEKFTDTLWDKIMNTLFVFGACMWWSFQRKLRDKLKAPYAIHLASGAGIPGTVIEQETHSEERENDNHSEDNVVNPNHGDDMHYKDYLGYIEDSIREEVESYFSDPTHVMAYIQDARGLRYKILFEVADCWNYNLDFHEDAAMDLLKKIVVRDVRKRLNIFLQTPIILRRWAEDDDSDENAPVTGRIFYDTLAEVDDGEDHDREDEENDNGEDDDGEDDVDEDVDGEDVGEDDDDEEDNEDEEEDNEEEENKSFDIHHLITKTWHYLTQTRGISWAVKNWRAYERCMERFQRRWTAMIRALRQDIRVIDNIWWIENPDQGEGECVFCERCPSDLRISEHSQRRYRRKYGLVRLLLYRG